MRSVVRYLLAVPAVMLLACAPPEEQPPAEAPGEPATELTRDDAAAIAEVRSAWQAAYDQDNAMAVADLYADDATLLLDARPGIVRGRQAINEHWSQAFPMASGLTLTPAETIVDGDLGYDVGEYRQMIQVEGQEPVEDAGKYLVVLQREADGTWRIQSHAAMSDTAGGMPQEPQATGQAAQPQG